MDADLYAVNRLVDGYLLYVHFNNADGYFFKVGMIGCCAFTKSHAEAFVSSNGCVGVRISKLEKTPQFAVVKSISQVDTDLFVKKSQKAAKKRIKKRLQKAKNLPQGPDAEETAIPPSLVSD